ncbi:unnamed protein product [Meganyctiphanes norvegica]|uniref:Uncharacterized protein n=1 Tax=Meganyctiphanes norvegica TaxID=48144 RepID=A0AAV2SKZ0_MEGNR
MSRYWKMTILQKLRRKLSKEKKLQEMEKTRQTFPPNQPHTLTDINEIKIERDIQETMNSSINDAKEYDPIKDIIDSTNKFSQESSIHSSAEAAANSRKTIQTKEDELKKLTEDVEKKN